MTEHLDEIPMLGRDLPKRIELGILKGNRPIPNREALIHAVPRTDPIKFAAQA